MHDVHDDMVDEVKITAWDLPAWLERNAVIDERELAAWIKVGRQTPAMWRHRRQGPPFIRLLPSRMVRYRVAEVLVWLESGRNVATTTSTA
ncbi:MAG TPA: hypothetical protein VH539_15570 [Gemmatimonadaceae bacterium]|jgi:hypothetical protein